MAGQSVIGALRVTLGADTAHFDKNMKEAASRLQGFSNSAKRAGVVIGAALGGLVVAAGVGFKNAIDEADKLGKMAQSIGIPVEELSKLKHAADLSDVSLEALGTSVGRLSRNMVQAAADVRSGPAQAFQALGISVRDSSGNMKSASAIVAEVADKFQGFEDGAAKTAIAIALFGRAGAAMIPMLNQGGRGIRDLAQEAEGLGIVIDTKTAKAAEEFNDNLRRLSIINGAFTRQLALELAPALSLLTRELITVAQDTDGVKSRVTSLVDVFANLLQQIFDVAQVFRHWGAQVSAFLEVAGAKTWREMTEAWSKWREEVAKTVEFLERGGTAVQDFRDRARMLADAAADTGNAVKRVAAPIIGLGQRTGEAFDKMLASVRKNTANMEADAQAVGLAAGERERLRVIMQGLNWETENNTKMTARQKAALDAAATGAKQAALNLEGAKIFHDLLPPMQKYEEEIRNATEALRAHGATQDVIAQKAMQIRFPSLTGFIRDGQDLNKTFDQLATSGLNTFADGLADISTKTKSASEAFKEMANSFIRDVSRMLIRAATAQAIGSVIGSFSGISTGTVSAGGGGIVGVGPFAGNAMGTNNWRGGPTWVGERGPELLNLPRGSQIIPNHELGGPAGSISVPINIQLDARGADRDAVMRSVQMLEHRIPSLAVNAVRDARSRRGL